MTAGKAAAAEPEVDAVLVLRLADAREAEAALAALAPENGDHLRAEVDGSVLRLVVPAGRLTSVQATVDDALACLTAAVGSMDAGGEAATSADDPDD